MGGPMKILKVLALLCLGSVAHAQLSPYSQSIPGIYTSGTLKSAASYTGFTAYTTDLGPVYSDGVSWISMSGGGIPPTVATGTILGNNSGSTAAPTGITGISADTSGNLALKRVVIQGAMNFTTTVTPNIQSAVNATGTNTSGLAAFNTMNVNSDSLNTTTGSGQGGAYNLYVGQTINNALMTGHRTGVEGFESITGASGNGIGTNKFYTGVAGQCNANHADNGIAGAGNAVGNCFGIFASARLQSGATYWNSDVGMEIDEGINSGASAAYEHGLQIVHWATAAVKGSTESTALSFGDQTGATAPWDRLIGIGSSHGIFPVNGGTIMGAVATTLGGDAYSVAHGIDFVNNGGLTCTVDCWASTGAALDGSGNWSAVKYTSTVATGTAPLVVASTTNVPNLNASSLNGATFAAPGAIGGTTPAAGTFTSVTLPTTTGNQIPVVAWTWGVPFGIPPSGSFPNLGASHTAIYVVGQNPASAGTLSVSATSGSVTATFSAATLLGTASDVGRVISISDTTVKICTITAQSSTTVATCTLGATLSGTGAFANDHVWITGTPSTATASYSTPLPLAFPNAYFYFPANAINGSNTAGSYYAQCTSIAVCQIFGGINGGTNPLISTTTFPGLQASPTAFSVTGNGNFTQTTGGVLLFAMPIAANSLGADGSLTIETFAAFVNNSNTKSIQFRWGGTGVGQVATTSVAWQGYKRTIRNAGATNSQVMFPNGAGATTDVATSTSVPTWLALDTTTSLNVQPIFSLATSALDWVFDLGGTVTTQYAP
jgi:hypothetical protein